MTVLEIELIEHLDFDFAPPCEALYTDCSNTATWRAVRGCCGEVILFCQSCKDRVVNQRNQASRGKKIWGCHFCDWIGDNPNTIWLPID